MTTIKKVQGWRGGVVLAVTAMSILTAQAAEGDSAWTDTGSDVVGTVGDSALQTGPSDVRDDNTTPPALPTPESLELMAGFNKPQPKPSSATPSTPRVPWVLTAVDSDVPTQIDFGRIELAPSDVSEPMLLQPMGKRVSALGSTIGGGITAAETLESLYGLKTPHGLDALTDHEVAAGFALPVREDALVGLAYRGISADARWNTDRFWGAGAAPILVENNENHGIVLFLRVKF